MKIINAPDSSASLLSSILDPVKSLLRTTNNLARSVEVVSEIILDSAELTKEIASLSLTAQRDELLARRATLTIA